MRGRVARALVGEHRCSSRSLSCADSSLRPLARGRNALRHERDEFARHEHIDTMAHAAAKDGPGDRVKLGLAAGGDVGVKCGRAGQQLAFSAANARAVRAGESTLVDPRTASS